MLTLLPLAAAALRGFSLPGWFLLPESVLLVIPLRILYWEKGGGRWGDYLGGVLHVYLYFFFLHNTAPLAPYLVAPILGLWWLAERALYFGLKRWAPVALAGAAAVVAATAPEVLPVWNTLADASSSCSDNRVIVNMYA